MKVVDILASIDQGTMALPEFQRGYVWSRDQVRGLMQSLYKRYPVGSLLVWQTQTEIAVKGDKPLFGNTVQLLLDGQQRITTLYGIMRGEAPPFFQGNAKAFTSLYFNLDSETFEFYGPVKMKGDPLWVDLTALYTKGIGAWLAKIRKIEGLSDGMQALYFERLTKLFEIGNVDLHIEQIVGANRTVDEVVDIFNRVNSGGTKLSKGDLTLARICAEWPQARQQMNKMLEAWASHGYVMKLDWLLRVTNAIVTGQSQFDALRGVPVNQVSSGLDRAEKAVNDILTLLSSRLGIDHDRVLAGRYAIPVMARYIATHDGPLTNEEQQLLLFWYLHSVLWGRHAGSTETVLQQDLQALEEGIPGLVKLMELWRGDLRVRPDHFAGAARSSRFYPMLYVMTRVGGAQDLRTGIELKKSLLGKLSSLELHHIFPRALLRRHGYPPSERNALANFCFLTKESNLDIGASAPEVYLAEVAAAHPDALASQWIPDDPELWKVENYPKFLERRRELLAAAANELLDALHAGMKPVDESVLTPAPVVMTEPEDEVLAAIGDLMRGAGLAQPELHFEILDEDSGEILVIADAAWPRGMQEGLGDRVAFLFEFDEEMEERLAALDYRFFSDLDALHRYVEELTGLDLDGDGLIGGGDALPRETASESAGGVPAAARVMVETMAPAAEAHLRLAYLERCVDELDLEIRLPQPGRRRKYLTIYPRSDRGVARVARLSPGSGRLVIFVPTAWASDYRTAEVVTRSDKPFAVGIYLRSPAAVNDAIALTRRALR